jgi:hypothetical protein
MSRKVVFHFCTQYICTRTCLRVCVKFAELLQHFIKNETSETCTERNKSRTSDFCQNNYDQLHNVCSTVWKLLLCASIFSLRRLWYNLTLSELKNNYITGVKITQTDVDGT